MSYELKGVELCSALPDGEWIVDFMADYIKSLNNYRLTLMAEYNSINATKSITDIGIDTLKMDNLSGCITSFKIYVYN